MKNIDFSFEIVILAFLLNFTNLKNYENLRYLKVNFYYFEIGDHLIF